MKFNLRYGLNPHQSSAQVIAPDDAGFMVLSGYTNQSLFGLRQRDRSRSGKRLLLPAFNELLRGKPSYINILVATR